MQLPATSRHTRVRRLLAVSAAAVAVMIGPTACDYGSYGGGSSSGGSSSGGSMDDMPGMNHGSDNQQHVVIPVAQTADTTEASAADDDETAEAATTTTAAAAAEERRRDRDGRRRGDRRLRRSATIPVPVNSATAEPAATDAPSESAEPTESAGATASASAAPTTAPAAGGQPVPLGRTCDELNATLAEGKKLPAHTGFQSADAQCVSTEMGAVAPETSLPSLLITDFPKSVRPEEDFTLQVSTRNLVRDRFLGAAAGGYYLESSFLDDNGLQRGHFHTACRYLDSLTAAPDSAPAPEFFVATQDNGGGAAPDTVSIQVDAAKMTRAGTIQCTSWAGDGSHRTPMMSRANQTPAIDSVRITVAGNAPAVQTDVNDAEVAADAAAQTEAQQEAAAEGQAPDQDGAPQLNGADDTENITGATAPAATTSATTTSAPADATTEN